MTFDSPAIDGALRALEATLGVPLPEPTHRAFVAYGKVVTDWRERTDLVAARDAAAFADVLFADALAALRGGFFAEEGRLVDVGAGVGAPTLPLLLALPRWSAVLVEPRRKRVAFLRTAIGRLDLGERARVVEGRIDPASPKLDGGPFHVAISRATFAPVEWLAIGARLARRTLVLAAREEPPAAPAGLRAGAPHRYATESTGAPRSITAYDRDGAATRTRSPG